MSRSIRTLAAKPKSAGSPMMEMVHAAMSTPARLLGPSNVALTTSASNRRSRCCRWRKKTNLSMSNILPCLKPHHLIHRFTGKSLRLASVSDKPFIVHAVGIV